MSKYTLFEKVTGKKVCDLAEEQVEFPHGHEDYLVIIIGCESSIHSGTTYVLKQNAEGASYDLTFHIHADSRWVAEMRSSEHDPLKQ